MANRNSAKQQHHVKESGLENLQPASQEAMVWCLRHPTSVQSVVEPRVFLPQPARFVLTYLAQPDLLTQITVRRRK